MYKPGGWHRTLLGIFLFLGIVIGFYFRDLLREKPAAAKLVTITSRNLNFVVATTAETIEEVLAEQNVVAPFMGPDESGNYTVQGKKIYIEKPVNIVLIDGGNETQLTTKAVTVGDLLYEQNIGLALTDRVTPGLDAFLAEGSKITIDRIVDLEVSERSEVPFEIQNIKDPDLLYGREVVETLGAAGEKEQLFLMTYKNGVEIKRKLLKTTVLEKPVAEVRKFGTKILIEETIEGRASWYSYRRCICAAHPFYDKGRYVRVTSLSTGKSIIAKINDRGPDLKVHPDRVIDLDAEAYKALAPLGSGTIAVKVELLKN